MKFTIRDLLLVTVIVALAVGWTIDHRRQANSAEAREELHWENFRLLMDHRNAGEFHIDSDGRVSLPSSSAPAPDSPHASATHSGP